MLKEIIMNLLELLPYQKLTLGDTFSWKVSLQDYPSGAGWVLNYCLKGVGQAPFTINSTANTDQISHDIKLIPADQTGLVAGKYKIQISITSSTSERTSLGVYDLELLPDLSTTDASYDPRSFNERALEAIEQVLFNAASRDYLETVFKDNTVKFKSNAELLSLRNEFRRLVADEKGIPHGRFIYFV